MWRASRQEVSIEGVRSLIESVAGRRLSWDVIRIGHPECHGYLPTLVIGSEIVRVVEDAKLVGDFVAAFSSNHADRREG